MGELRDLLHHAADLIADYREALPDTHVGVRLSYEELLTRMDAPMADGPATARGVIDELVERVTPALVASAGPRYYGLVVGGSVDAALVADVLAAGWDQLAFNATSSPAAAIAEQVTGKWLKDLLGIPTSASVGFVTGAQAANTVGLAAARHEVLRRVGWDLERDGLAGAPAIQIVGSVERHVTVDRSLRFLGIGRAAVVEVPADGNGAIDVAALTRILERRDQRQPAIVCLQAGNVNTGAYDALRPAIEAGHASGAWVHVDGAFGLWAAASPRFRHLVDGIELADSWGCDGHKWLNVPYDSAYAFCAHPQAHRAAMSLTASYLVGQGDTTVHNAADWVTESSRRARGFATWAALRQLGREGVAQLVEGCCAHAARFAERLAAAGFQIRNEVVLNQVLVRVAGDASTTDAIIDAIQREGTCWLGGTTWHGERLLRISVSNHLTTDADVDRSVDAIVRACRAYGERGGSASS